MQFLAIAALLAGAAIASPVPQDFDWDAIADVDPVPTASVPVVDAVAAQTTITYSATAAASSVVSAIIADPSDTSLKMVKREDNSGCAASAVPSSDDTADNFSANPAFPSAASSAVTPKGYTQNYVNQQGSSEGIYGYMGYSVLSTYDTSACSAKCDAIVGCQSFNLYFERDPSVDPTATCSDPSSQTVIKCVFYGGPISAASATNVGQYRYDFHVVIAGSNAYTNNSIATPPGYSGPVYLGTSAINAPNDCAGHNTYMGVKIFNSGPFDAGRCAAACSATSDYARAHPPKVGAPMTCQFYNTYILYNNTVPVGQYCSMYNETWSPAFATNNGQYRGKDHFTINYSFTFSNTTAGADKPAGCTNPSKPKN